MHSVTWFIQGLTPTLSTAIDTSPHADCTAPSGLVLAAAEASRSVSVSRGFLGEEVLRSCFLLASVQQCTYIFVAADDLKHAQGQGNVNNTHPVLWLAWQLV